MILTTANTAFEALPYNRRGYAKQYDGSFVHDTITNFPAFSNTTAFTFFSSFYLQATAQQLYLFDTRASLSNAQQDIVFLILASGALQFLVYNNATKDVVIYRSIESLNFNDYNTVCLCFSGNGYAVGTDINIVVNGVYSTTLFLSQIANPVFTTSNLLTINTVCQVPNPVARFFKGYTKTYQFLNSDYANTQQLNNAVALGSFTNRVNPSNFMLDIDYNKTGSQALTTKPNTPNYIINSFGGASYAKYSQI